MQNLASPIVGRKIKIALIGCGRAAQSHFAAINAHQDNLQLVAVCDRNSQARKQVQERYEIAAYADVGELLASSDADVVSICTPSGLHAPLAISCAKAAKHVLVEKPMATRFADGVSMVKACDEAAVRLFVIKQNRFNATMRLLKQAVSNGRFGRIYMAAANVFWQREQAYYDQASWRGTWEFDGGALMNQASHYLDLLHWLLGPVASVQAMMSTLARNIEVEDSGVLNIKWRNGALGSVNVTVLTYPDNLEGSITILGEKGTVRIGGVAVNEVQHWKFADKQPEDKGIYQASYATESVYGFGHVDYYRNMLEVLRGEAEPEIDGREGLKSLELLTAAYRAARDQVQVSLPLVL